MKTLKQITLTAVMIVVSSQMIMAGSFKSFQLEVSAGRFVEVLTRVEALLEEETPKAPETRFENSPSLRILDLMLKEEELLDEELPAVTTEKQSQVFVSLNPILAQLQKPEPLLEENEIDTHAVFESIKTENTYRLDNKTLAKFCKHECELDEETFANFHQLFTAK